MTERTEAQLNALIDDLTAKLADAEQRAYDAEQRADDTQRKLESDNLGWSAPRDLADHLGSIGSTLAVPRLEMHWTRDDEDGFSTTCTYMLVYKHFLDGCGDKRHITGAVLGQTRVRGGRPRESFFSQVLPGDRQRIDMPFRDTAHALHDAAQLRLPLFVTTEDLDVANVSVTTREHELMFVGGKAML